MQHIKNLFNRKIINDPKLQYGIVGFFVFLSLLNLIFMILLLAAFKSHLLTDVMAMDAASRSFMTEVIENWSPVILNAVVTFGGFVILFSFMCGLVLLQKIAGPIYVLKKYLQQTLEGRTDRQAIRLRKNDFLTDVIDLINKIDEKYTYVEKGKK